MLKTALAAGAATLLLATAACTQTSQQAGRPQQTQTGQAQGAQTPEQTAQGLSEVMPAAGGINPGADAPEAQVPSSGSAGQAMTPDLYSREGDQQSQANQARRSRRPR